jgi:hypothetical protein
MPLVARGPVPLRFHSSKTPGRGQQCVVEEVGGDDSTLLHLRVAPGKVVKRLGPRLGPVDGKGQVVVLEVEADAGEVDDGFHAGLAELVGVT